MFAPRSHWLKTLPIALLITASVLAISAWAAEPPRRARPPKFAKSITDAFYPDAREKLSGPRPEPAAKPAETAVASPSAKSTGAPPGAKGSPWSRLISAEAIEDEIKAQQIKLAEAVANANKFKGGEYRAARAHLSLLAVLFAIDAEYGQPMRWQREAPGVRDMLAAAGMNCKVGTDGSYKNARTASEELQNLIRGGSVSGFAATEAPSWAKVAERTQLMKRLEQSQQQALAPWTASAAVFAKNREKLAHEAQLAAALGAVINQEGYEFADDDTYREYAQAIENAGVAVREAAEQDNYDRARAAAVDIGKACTNCHEGFRN